MKPAAPLPYANALKTNGFGLLENPCRLTKRQADEPEGKKKEKQVQRRHSGRLFVSAHEVSSHINFITA
jgi:hypothetical protein